MKFKMIILITVVSILGGCATGYHARNSDGGYSEVRTNPDSFIVSFNGNGCTKSEECVKYVLLRASELTIKNGFKYFVILSQSDDSYTEYYSSSTYFSSAIKPGKSVRIKCFTKDPKRDDAIDARYYWNQNKPKDRL